MSTQGFSIEPCNPATDAGQAGKLWRRHSSYPENFVRYQDRKRAQESQQTRQALKQLRQAQASRRESVCFLEMLANPALIFKSFGGR